MLKHLPDEIMINIYKFINPISLKNEYKAKDWCANCGEYIGITQFCVEMKKNNKIKPLNNCFFANYNNESNHLGYYINEYKVLYCLNCFNYNQE